MTLDSDDPALVSMRAWHREVDLRGSGSVLSGQLAFPITARGRSTTKGLQYWVPELALSS